MTDTDKLVAATLAAGAMASVPNNEFANNAAVAVELFEKICKELEKRNAANQ